MPLQKRQLRAARQLAHQLGDKSLEQSLSIEGPDTFEELGPDNTIAAFQHSGEICKLLTDLMEQATEMLASKTAVVEKVVEKEVIVEKVVEKPVEVVVEKIVERVVERVVERPVVVEKIVETAAIITGRDILYRHPDIQRYLKAVVAVEEPHGRVPSNFRHISGDMYQFGSRRIQILEQNGQVVVRVGGGFSDFIDFLYRFGEGEAKKLAKELAELDQAQGGPLPTLVRKTKDTGKGRSSGVHLVRNGRSM